jgi:signal peptidase I
VAVAVALAGCGDKSDGDRLFRIPSPAMLPTIKAGYHASVDTDAYAKSGPRRGDIVVFHPPVGATTHECGIPSQPADGHPCAAPTTANESEVTFIKRVVALPGETVYIRNNRTYVNGKPLPEPYIRSSPCEVLCSLPKPVKIPAGHYFALGDNRGESDDSRDWGPFPREQLVGKVVAVCPPSGCGNE